MKPGLLATEFGVAAPCDPVQVVADGRGVGRASDRQDVPEQVDRHPVRHQRGELAFQVQQFRRGVLGQQRGQRAEGLGLRGWQPQWIKARAGQPDHAEGRAEGDRLVALDRPAPAAGGQGRWRAT